LEGFPLCAAPRSRSHHVPVPKWVAPLDRVEPVEGAGHCSECPGEETCVGIPLDYVERFGYSEFRSEGGIGPAGRTGSAPGEGEPTTVARVDAPGQPPEPRAGRAPATRIRAIARKVVAGELKGQVLSGLSRRPVAESVRVVFGGPSPVQDSRFTDSHGDSPESSRGIRLRLLESAQEGASLLRIASTASMHHPVAPELLQEATRLGFSRVTVAGEMSPIYHWSERQIRRLRGIHRFDGALFGPSAESHDAACGGKGFLRSAVEGLTRVGEILGVEVGMYAVLCDVTDLSGFARLWREDRIPGEPAFRLSASGGRLRDLAEAAVSSGELSIRQALLPMLPPCLTGSRSDSSPLSAQEAWGDLPKGWETPSRGDLAGAYHGCPQAERCEAAVDCPGLAVGWASEGIQPVLQEERGR